uniref:Uncharacterized protein n=1 Tax=Rhizophora mucronata TaxID=61149 RepID=A0A2P2NKG3_RHIMU
MVSPSKRFVVKVQ